MPENKPLLTVWGERLDRAAPLPEYPRPQLVRDSYLSLNGLWHFAVTETEDVPEDVDGEILVPFAPESVLSGAGVKLLPGCYLWLSRSFTLPEGFLKSRLILNFGAVDQSATVYLNGIELGTHSGGYTPFSVELTSALNGGKNILMLRVQDPTDSSWHVCGGQSLKPGGDRHSALSGIWQSVWLESVPEKYIHALRIRPLFDEKQLELTVLADSGESCTVSVMGDSRVIETNYPRLLPIPDAAPWTPEEPKLYDFSVSYGEDHVKSYFALRSLCVEKDAKGTPRLFLNGKPYFLNGVLDSGLWPDGLYTAPSDEAIISDLSRAKETGFNTIRKRDKLEPLRWYYHCDRLGLLVIQDIPAGGGRTSPLPKAIKLDDSLPLTHALLSRKDDAGRWHFQRELSDVIKSLYNCPCIVIWTLFNEGRGQFDSLQLCESIRELDKDRLIDHAGGWFDQGIGSLKSLHSFSRGFKYSPDKSGRAVILSEYGGCGNSVPGHTTGDAYSAHRRCETPLELEETLRGLFRNISDAASEGLSAAIYRQLTDTQDELDGLITADRKITKLSESTLKSVFGSVDLS